MRVLFYISTAIGEDNILWGLLELPVEAEKSELVVKLDIIDSRQIEIIASESAEYDCVITRNFSVNVAEGCHISGTPYVSWCYDSPVMALFTDYAFYPTNYIFAFDKIHLQKLKKMGIDHVYHQPLAANMIKAESSDLSNVNLENSICDVSFVGGMYESDFYPFFKNNAPERIIDECEDLFASVLCRWDIGDKLFDRLSEEAVKTLSLMINRDYGMDLHISERYLTEMTVLVYELTSRERYRVLNRAGLRFNTVIHTRHPEKLSGKMSATVLPPLDQLSDKLYKVYADAKINLNLTMRSIESGVPQRVYDIMSIGGCVFSNFQEEAAELFEENKEIILFKSLEEFEDKAEYYLTHERERLNICYSGYMKVKECYNYPTAIRNMLDKL